MLEQSPHGLIPVELSRVRNWRDHWTRESVDPSAYGYSLRLPDEPDNAFEPNTRALAFAECYGGSGVGANAGGVRCANLNGVQIKGIGSTILAGQTTDKWHKHGACSTQDAIKEAIFSQLMDAALPHGGVKAIAVLDLGLRFATEVGVEKLPSSAPRALFVREQSIRVAHFMRSSFVNAGPEMATREVLRMRDGIPRLANALSLSRQHVSMASVALGVTEMYSRLMQQVAALRARRLIHGSLIPSNFCVDGRMLDFTTSTALSTLQPVVVALGGETSHGQHRQVLESLPDVLFYIAKFDPRCATPRKSLQRLIEHVRESVFAAHLLASKREYAALLGFSSAEVLALSAVTLDALFDAIMGLIRQGSVDGHLYFGGDEHPMIQATGRDDLLGVFIWAALSHDQGDQVRRELIFSRCSLDLLRAARTTAVRELGARFGDERDCVLARLVRVLKLNGDLSRLYRRNLDGDIDDLCKSGAPIAPFIDAISNRWRSVFSSPLRGETHLQHWFTSQAFELNSSNAPTIAGKDATWVAILDDLVSHAIPARLSWLNARMRALADDGCPNAVA